VIAVELIKLNDILFFVGSVALIAVTSYFLLRWGINHLLIWVHAILGLIFLSISIWEAAGAYQDRVLSYLEALWGITMVITVGMPIVIYVVMHVSKEYQFTYGKLVRLILLVCGCYMFYGVLEDFGCYVIWGIETLSPSSYGGIHHQEWFYGLFPTLYFLAIPGIILIIVAFYWSRRSR